MSSLIFLGFSSLAFLISFGVVYLLMPIVFGVFFGVLNDIIIPDEEWREAYIKNQELAVFLTYLAPTMGIFMFILKVGMAASARGRD